jgi:hypothetical protein
MFDGVIGRSVVATVSALWLWPAAAEPLVVVDVAAPAINCVFNTTCKIVVTDSAGALAIPGLSGNAFLQSRTFAGAPGTPAAGMTGYEFRVDLTQATAGAAKVCVTGLKLGLGPLSKLPYPGGLGPGEVFVITAGGLGTVGLATADRTEGAIAFAFLSPVCPGTASTRGQTSYFFGFAAVKPPHPVTAQVRLDNGQMIDVPARAPAP